MTDLNASTVLAWLIDWTQQHPAWTGGFVFAVAMLESLTIVGIAVPGALLMSAFGALIALGALDFWPITLWAIAGAIVGDGLSFWLGYHYGDRLRALWPFYRYEGLLQRGEIFFQRHGGKSIVFGRFVGPVRAIIPTIAGMLGMSPWRFLFVNVFSACAWAPAYLLPGLVFGASLELASEVATRLALLLALVVAVLVLGLWLIRRVFAYLQPRADALLTRILRWSQARRGTARGLGGLSAALIDPRRPESRALVVFAALLLLMGLTFFYITTQVAGAGHTLGIDAVVHRFMQSLRTPWGDTVMVAVTMLGDWQILTALTVVLCAWLLWRRNLPAALHWLAAVAFGSILTRLLKITFQVPRPEGLDGNTIITSFSFPSGHTTMSTVVYGFLAVLISRELPRKTRGPVYLAAGGLILSIAVSRLYLGAHWFSDVLGGLSLGLAWIALLGIAYRRHAAPPVPARGLFILTAVTLSVGGAAHWTLQHRAQVQSYAPVYPVRSLASAQWWNTAWQTLPARRADVRAHNAQPLNVQYAGELATLRRQLTGHGWEPPPAANWRTALQWLRPNPPLRDLPVLPHVHQGRHETLRLRHLDSSGDGQWVLRLWPADVHLQPGDIPLWVGSVSQQRRGHSLYALTYPVTQTDFDAPLQALLEDLQGLQYTASRRPARKADPRVQWDGTVVRIRAGERP